MASKMRGSQVSQSGISLGLSRLSMTSYPMFGSDFGAGLTASAYSKYSRRSGISRTRSVSPNAQAPSRYSNEFPKDYI